MPSADYKGHHLFVLDTTSSTCLDFGNNSKVLVVQEDPGIALSLENCWPKDISQWMLKGKVLLNSSITDILQERVPGPEF